MDIVACPWSTEYCYLIAKLKLLLYKLICFLLVYSEVHVIGIIYHL